MHIARNEITYLCETFFINYHKNKFPINKMLSNAIKSEKNLKKTS